MVSIDPSIVSAVSSVISTLVVVIGGLVALRQLRFARHANELATLTKFAELWETEPLQKARHFIRDELPNLMRDPAFVAEVRQTTTGGGGVIANLTPLTNFYEDMATYVYTGALSEKTVMLIYGGNVAGTWNGVRGVMVLLREAQGDDIGNMFEHLAMRATAWRAQAERREFRRLLRDPEMPASASFGG
ncbi:MAG: hypothetical protein ABR975_14870 [Vulcanimicrobiaceae bacterium]|jgi:hypothetical protein